jgi:hypothetical protein
MVEGFIPAFGGGDSNTEIVFNAVLADKII